MSASAVPSGFVIEVEQEVLGTLLTGGDFRKVAGILDQRYFYEPVHGLLYGVIKCAFEQYNSTSVPVVAKLIPEDLAMAFKARLNIYANSYLASLAAGTVYGAEQLELNARKVVSQWARLTVAEEAARLHAAALDPASDTLQIVTRAAQAFDDVLGHVRRGPRRKTRLSLSEAAGNAITASREAAQRGHGLTGISWGLADVNRLTGGLQRRDLTLIAARPSMGKTTVGLSIALAASRTGVGVGFISLEMDGDKLGARAVSDLAYDWGVKVAYADIIRGKADQRSIEAIESATRDIGRLPLCIEDQPGLSMSDIRIKTEAMLAAAEKAGTPLELLVIDHMGLIKPSSRYQGNRVQEVGEMSAGLKSLAREYGLAVVALSQLNRALEGRTDKRPQLSDLRDSGSLEQDADTIIFLYREAYYLEREKGGSLEAEADRTERLINIQNKLEFHIAKQRNGPIASVDLFADMACSAVRNGARQ
jgi:replicative DNA helicase